MRERKDDQGPADGRGRQQSARTFGIEVQLADSSAGTEVTFGDSKMRPIAASRCVRARSGLSGSSAATMPSTITTTKGTQIAASEQHQRARSAAVRHHHAIAEQQAAKEHQRRRKRRLQIDRLAEIDHLPRGKELGRGDRHPECQPIGPHQPAVALRPPAAQAAERGKTRSRARPHRRRGRSPSRHRGQYWLRPALAFPWRCSGSGVRTGYDKTSRGKPSLEASRVMAPAAGSRGRATSPRPRERPPWHPAADRSLADRIGNGLSWPSARP